LSSAKWIACACSIASASAIGYGYAQDAQIYSALAFALAGAFWCEALLRSWRWPASPLLVFFTCSAVYGAWQGFSPFIMLVGILAALSAWDLDYMLQRFAQVKPAALMPGLARRHLQRLAAVNGLGLLLGCAALLIQVHISFTLTVLLGLAAFIALSLVVVYLRRATLQER
jgi:hypothetical protein